MRAYFTHRLPVKINFNYTRLLYYVFLNSNISFFQEL